MKQIRVRTLEKDKVRKFYLIERFYPKVLINEFVVAISYNFKQNTFKKGLITEDVVAAYSIFNYLSNTNELPESNNS